MTFENVKYFAQEDFEQTRLRNRMQTWINSLVKHFTSFRLIELINGGITTIGFIITLTVVLLDFSKQYTSTGDLVLAISFVTIFYPKLLTVVYQF